MPSRQERRIKATQELAHKGHVVFRELRERPGSDRMLLLARVLTTVRHMMLYVFGQSLWRKNLAKSRESGYD